MLVYRYTNTTARTFNCLKYQINRLRDKTCYVLIRVNAWFQVGFVLLSL